MSQNNTYKSKTGKTAIQFTGNRIHLTGAVFRLDSGQWHCVEEIEIDYEITDSEIATLVEDHDRKEYDFEESLFSMSEGMI